MLNTNRLAADFEGYGLTTAQIVYRMPDRMDWLQEFVWQEFDLFPQFPALRKFLLFWQREIDGPLHSVTVSHQQLIRPAVLQIPDGEFRIN